MRKRKILILNCVLAMSAIWSMTGMAGESSGGGSGTYLKMTDSEIVIADVLANNPAAIEAAQAIGNHFCGGFITSGASPVNDPHTKTTSYNFQVCQTLPNGIWENLGTLTIIDREIMGVDRISHTYEFFTQRQ